MSDCSPVSTPMSAKPHNFLDSKFKAKEVPYAKLIGKLLYASNYTSPSINASVNYLIKYMSHPHVEHQLQAKRVLRYLKGTQDKGLLFDRNVPFTLITWQDSFFADGPDGKSRTGYAVLMCESVVACMGFTTSTYCGFVQDGS